MKTHLKKLLTLTLALCFLVTPLALIAQAEGIEPRYNNTMMTYNAMTISDSGKLSIVYDYDGVSGVTTKAVITTYIEKRFLLFFWQRVDIGTTDNQWVDTFYKDSHGYTRSYQLTDEGTYRVKVTYKIYGSGGAADTIEYEATDSY